MSVQPSRRSYGRIFIFAGFVGLAYAIKLAWLRRRMRQVALYRSRERDLHRACMAQLDAEQKTLIDAQQATHQAAAEYWKHLPCGMLCDVPTRAPAAPGDKGAM